VIRILGKAREETGWLIRSIGAAVLSGIAHDLHIRPCGVPPRGAAAIFQIFEGLKMPVGMTIVPK
jgi:hypothetical protein